MTTTTPGAPNSPRRRKPRFPAWIDATSRHLTEQALFFRAKAEEVRKTGRPVEVPWKQRDTKVIHQLTADDLDAEADNLARDADKLLTLYTV